MTVTQLPREVGFIPIPSGSSFPFPGCHSDPGYYHLTKHEHLGHPLCATPCTRAVEIRRSAQRQSLSPRGSPGSGAVVRQVLQDQVGAVSKCNSRSVTEEREVLPGGAEANIQAEESEGVNTGKVGFVHETVLTWHRGGGRIRSLGYKGVSEWISHYKEEPLEYLEDSDDIQFN